MTCPRCSSETAAQCVDKGCHFLESGDSEPRMPPQYYFRNITPKEKPKPAPPVFVPLVWWRVKLQAGAVTAERDISIRTEDARVVAEYCARNYPSADLVSIHRMKRAPRR